MLVWWGIWQATSTKQTRLAVTYNVTMFCNGKAKTLSVYIVQCAVCQFQQTTNTESSHKNSLSCRRQQYKVHIKCPIFSSDFNLDRFL
jgi:hypothetical protein